MKTRVSPTFKKNKHSVVTKKLDAFIQKYIFLLHIIQFGNA